MGLEQHVSIPTQLKLHFEKMGHLKQPKPLVFNAQQVRMDFIQYCIHQGPKLGTPESTLEEYLKTDKEKLAVSNPDEVLTPGDLNRRKLSALFAHLSAFNYKMGGLTIEPIAVGDLIKKIHDINGMDDKRVAEYLETLVGSQIPGAQEMPLDKFLENVGAMYQENGVNFHCYLRENFFQPLNKESIKEAAPALNYFMPEVFCQRHINTCELSTAMSILKKACHKF